MAGAPTGNTNATKNKVWSDALHKELAGNKNAKKLRKLARVLIKEASTGNIPALKEIGDRLEGKPNQTIQSTVEGEVDVIHHNADEIPFNSIRETAEKHLDS